MPLDQEYTEENDSYQEEEQQSYQEENKNPYEAQFQELKDQIAGLQGLLAKSQRSEEPKKPQLTSEQMAEIARDPALLGQYVQAQLSQTEAKLNRQQQKVHYDKLAEDRFPALKTNKELQQKVAQKMKEMVDVTGEYSWESPTLLLRAAEIVAPVHGGMLEVNKKRGNEASTLEASNTSSMQRRGQARTKVDENDPRLKFAELFGIRDPKKLEAFKQQLGPYKPTERKRGRSLVK